MGEVYRARDPRLARDVAIKVLPEEFLEGEERRQRFEREAKLLAALNHPGIAAVYSFEEIPGSFSSSSSSSSSTLHILVMELLEGETLRAALAGAKVSTKKALEWARQIAQGLSAAHEKGIVHRDLKPENVFVTKDGRVKILDFGLAKLAQADESPDVTNLPTATRGTEPGVVMGTLGYMSPEQVKGKPADARSDIFSFGAILYEMLSGQRAFHRETAAETISAILKEDPPDLTVTNQNVPPGLERLVAHCLEKNPEQRFHSAHDLAFDLESVTGASGARAAAPSAAGWRTGRRAGRRRAPRGRTGGRRSPGRARRARPLQAEVAGAARIPGPHVLGKRRMAVRVAGRKDDRVRLVARREEPDLDQAGRRGRGGGPDRGSGYAAAHLAGRLLRPLRPGDRGGDGGLPRVARGRRGATDRAALRPPPTGRRTAGRSSSCARAPRAGRSTHPSGASRWTARTSASSPRCPAGSWRCRAGRPTG